MTFLYERLLKPLLFSQDPERMHDAFVRFGSILGTLFPARWFLSAVYTYRHPILRQNIAGITFDNPVGLAAGFDKDCNLLRVLPSIGFGFIEVGSITAEPYGGNAKPRAVRLPADQAIIVNYGLKNKGAVVLRRRLLGKRFGVPVGVSIAKTNTHFLRDEEKLDDWLRGIKLLKDCGDYLTLNLSCPNTYDSTNYCNPHLLEQLLKRIEAEKLSFSKPVFLKVAADVDISAADKILSLCTPRRFITGFIISNLVKDRSKVRLKSPRAHHEPFAGGISGKVQQPHALNLVTHFRKRAGDRFVLIGVGGIFSAEDAYGYITSGASLVQLITGMIYKGPGLIKDVNKGLVRLLQRDGFTNIAAAVGSQCGRRATRSSLPKI